MKKILTAEDDKEINRLICEYLSSQGYEVLSAMNGLDAIVFTAGMGENNPELRDRACTDMEYFGIEIDRELNARMHHQPNIVELSTPASRVKVYLIPTNEELMIARDTEAIVNKL